jgi:hypothetical protein
MWAVQPLSKLAVNNAGGSIMGKQIYRRIDPPDVQGICLKCGKNKQVSIGNGRYAPLCTTCRGRTGHGKRPDRRLICDRCGFVARHLCQIDIHHKDRNRKNNVSDNLENICANCHRLEHSLEFTINKKMGPPNW